MSKEQVVVARKKKKKVKIFPIVNVILFLVISLIIMVPIWKVIVDSFDAKAGYGMNFLPQTFTFGGYSSILSRVALYRPFLISVVVTIAGTFIGSVISNIRCLCINSVGNAGKKLLRIYVIIHNDFRWWYDS